MSFERDPAPRSLSPGSLLSLFAAALHLLSFGLGMLGLLVVVGLLLTLPSLSGQASSTELWLYGLGSLFSGAMVLIDLAVTVVLAVLGLRGLRGELTSTLVIVLVVGAVFDVLRLGGSVLGMSCLAVPLYLGMILVQSAAALLVSMERGTVPAP